MIRFNLVVEDVDAENILDCIQQEIFRCHDRLFICEIERLDSCFDQERVAREIDWNEKHIEYLKGLKLKMKNERIFI